MIRILTDSGCDISQEEAASLGITVLPINVRIKGKDYLDGVDLNPTQFYEFLKDVKSNNDLPKTSQVTPAIWEIEMAKAKENGDQIIAVSLGSGFSGGYNSLCLAVQEYEGIAYPVDSMNVSLGERAVVLLAKKLIDEGYSAEEVQKICAERAANLRVIASLDTLDFLKYGGRISKAVAFVGGILKIKPIVAVIDGHVKMVNKVRGSKFINKTLIEMVQKNGGVDETLPYCVGYTGLTTEFVDSFLKDAKGVVNSGSLAINHIGPTIGTHVGPDCVCFAYWGKENQEKKEKKPSVVKKVVASIKGKRRSEIGKTKAGNLK
ncbi:MAG: DegV family protein [Bacilli bacterium]|nr:DegV family protein [Bacilli bacterium]